MLMGLREALIQREGKLTNRATHFEEREYDGAVLEHFVQPDALPLCRGQCEVRSKLAGNECGHEAKPPPSGAYLDCRRAGQVAGASLRSILRVSPLRASFSHCLRVNQRALPSAVFGA